MEALTEGHFSYSKIAGVTINKSKQRNNITGDQMCHLPRATVNASETPVNILCSLALMFFTKTFCFCAALCLTGQMLDEG